MSIESKDELINSMKEDPEKWAIRYLDLTSDMFKGLQREDALRDNVLKLEKMLRLERGEQMTGLTLQ